MRFEGGGEGEGESEGEENMVRVGSEVGVGNGGEDSG